MSPVPYTKPIGPAWAPGDPFTRKKEFPGVKFNKFGRTINEVVWDSHQPGAIINPYQLNLEEFYGVLFSSRYFDSNFRNIRSGALLASGNHGYQEKAKTRAMFIGPNAELAFCLHWVVMSDGKTLDRCGEYYVILSGGCGVHKNVNGRGPNDIWYLWRKNKDAPIDILFELGDLAVQSNAYEGDTDEWWHMRVDTTVADMVPAQDPASAEKAAIAVVNEEFHVKYYIPGLDESVERAVANGESYEATVARCEQEWKFKTERRRQDRRAKSYDSSLAKHKSPQDSKNPKLLILEAKSKGKYSGKKPGSSKRNVYKGKGAVSTEAETDEPST
ncbi:hypothetical protein SLS60_000404 [Paraconiothyrium brasiliense]|uniref:Uncharacterized protein n=1 Tax=Paraconiothyrium brasiliense TaxID=300254 RepID=A0ABR3S686_9PLEO